MEGQIAHDVENDEGWFQTRASLRRPLQESESLASARMSFGDVASFASFQGAHRYMQEDNPGPMSLNSHRPIYVSQGCLLIPVFFAAWIYYTKKCFRRISGLIRNRPEADVSSEESFRQRFSRLDSSYIQWDDLMSSKNSSSTPASFVKWINRRNIRRRQAEFDVQSLTKRILSADSREEIDGIAGEGNKESSLMANSFSDEVPVEKEESSAKWEFLSHFGDIELNRMRRAESQEELSTMKTNPSMGSFSFTDLLQSDFRSTT